MGAVTQRPLRIMASIVRVALFGIVAATSVGAMAGRVSAQSSEIDTQLFLPTAGPSATFGIDRPEALEHGSFSLGLGSSFSTGLLIRNDGPGSERVLVAWRVQPEVYASVGLFHLLELGVIAPVSIVRSVNDPFVAGPTLNTDVMLSDIRLSAKAPLVRGPNALALKLMATVPTGAGTPCPLNGLGLCVPSRNYSGLDYWSLTPSAIGSTTLGRVTLGAELSYRIRRRALLGDLEIDDELIAAVGARWQVIEQLAPVAEAQWHVGIGGRRIGRNEIPLHGNVGARWTPNRHWIVDAGVGTSIIQGYGAPTFRVFGIVRYVFKPEHQCEYGPEDFDGYQDGDWCRDPDNDGDGIDDLEDDCPNDKEDVDQFLDEDGCPDIDNDADGLLDDEDSCPLVSEDVDGYEDGDGCPEPDNDDDGLQDGYDDCPMEPEDKDGYADDDGCPEPGPSDATITVTDTRIIVSERIYFDFDTESIRSVSYPLLDQVAGVINDLPADRRVRIEGYTDSAGMAEYNRDLSWRRSRAVVEYLVSKGVDRDRLEYVGYGAQHYVAPNDTPEGRALNRRVEFTILEPGEKARGGHRRTRPKRPQR